jgi:magnesium transporter
LWLDNPFALPFLLPPIFEKMRYLFTLNHEHLESISLAQWGADGAALVWVDLVAPTAEERAWVEQTFTLTLPQPTHLRDIEASARFYAEDGKQHLRSDFLYGKETEAHSVAVAFILTGNTLISVHEIDLPPFAALRANGHQQTGMRDHKDVLIDLYAMDVELSADALEQVYADLAGVSKSVLGRTLSDRQAAVALSNIARAEHLNGRIRRNVMDTHRAISFLLRNQQLCGSQQTEAQQILQDIDSLDGHTAFLFDKINFLMSSTVGFISINQNKIVRLFSVASVALLPPTLIASIYGMNFKNMPELAWAAGYPMALGLMLLSVAIPFWVFRSKGWLR